ncbi:hypothetical protein ACFL11_00350 [Patescibacteria group bacterium]
MRFHQGTQKLDREYRRRLSSFEGLMRRLGCEPLKLWLGKKGIEVVESQRRPFFFFELLLVLRVIWTDTRGEKKLAGVFQNIVEVSGFAFQIQRIPERKLVKCFCREYKGRIQIWFYNGFFAKSSTEEKIQDLIEAIIALLERLEDEAERKSRAKRKREGVQPSFVAPPKGPVAPRFTRSREGKPRISSASVVKPAQESFNDFLDRILEENEIAQRQYDYFVGKKGRIKERALTDFLRVTTRLSRTTTSAVPHHGRPIGRLTSSTMSQALVDRMIRYGFLVREQANRNNVLITEEGASIRRWIDENRKMIDRIGPDERVA